MVESEALIGKVIVGRYRIEALRSDSAAAVKVYEADDLRHNKKVSVRLMTTRSLIDLDAGLIDESSALSAYKELMQQLFAMNHPTLVCVDDWGDTVIDGVRHAFNVTEFYGQGTLREFLDRGRRLSPSQALVVGIDVCRALHHAHQNGFVHGDVRPANLIFGDDARVRLTGLGTKRSASAEQMSLEQAKYAAPEIGLGSMPNGQTDIYSLAITLLESITGEVPFVGESVAITLANRVDKLLPVNADMGPIAAPIERAGRPLADERGTALELGQALAQIADKMPRPLPIDTVVPKKFEDVITRPHPITSASEAVATQVVEQVEIAVPSTPVVVESPRTRKRLQRLFAVAVLGAMLIVGVVAFQVLTKKSFVVPDLTGVAEAEARNSIATNGWELIIRAERTNDVEFGFVIRTEPAAGESLKQGDALIIYVSEGAPLGVLVEVVGDSREVAFEKLTAQGLTVSATEDSSESVPIGNVISWSVAKQPSLAAGDQVLQGTVINLVVSNGPALRAVPLIVGLNLEQATAVAAELGLVLGGSADSFSNDAAAGLVGAQSPPPG
ncbi:MAG: PASTA domain-containing protein, partial [Actinobacteria bacterium]|nr:PASTA domain-containing protein [Actinomycetota bacterium]